MRAFFFFFLFVIHLRRNIIEAVTWRNNRIRAANTTTAMQPIIGEHSFNCLYIELHNNRDHYRFLHPQGQRKAKQVFTAECGSFTHNTLLIPDMNKHKDSPLYTCYINLFVLQDMHSTRTVFLSPLLDSILLSIREAFFQQPLSCGIVSLVLLLNLQSSRNLSSVLMPFY